MCPPPGCGGHDLSAQTISGAARSDSHSAYRCTPGSLPTPGQVPAELEIQVLCAEGYSPLSLCPSRSEERRVGKEWISSGRTTRYETKLAHHHNIHTPR